MILEHNYITGKGIRSYVLKDWFVALYMGKRKNTRSCIMNPDDLQETPQQAIEKYTTDFTKLAADGKLDPVIG
ncbi:MAG: hypothetical protein IJ273_00325, partial [Alphaproteobacteria bacterium]|nr:hypothetical protein [Alphaproteobacteria bacterium]